MPEPDERAASGRRDLFIVWLSIAVWAFATQGVTPLFSQYDKEFGLSTTIESVVFATYGFTLVFSLLLVGWTSDVLGRKRIMIACQVLYTIASVTFALAQGPIWLMVGRGLQGVSAGAFWSTATAFVRDLSPDTRRDSASIIVSTTMVGGASIGALTLGLLASATGTTTTPWLVHICCMLVVIALMLTTHETVVWSSAEVQRARPGLARLGRDFWGFVAPITLTVLPLGAIGVALVSAIVEDSLDGTYATLVSFSIAGALACPAVALLAFRHSDPERLTLWGTVSAPAGAAVVLAGIVVEAPLLLLAGFAVLGGAAGLAFGGLLGISTRLSTPQNRARVVSTWYVVAYAGQSIPVVVAGVVLSATGAAVAVALFGGLAAVTAIATYALRGGAVSATEGAVAAPTAESPVGA